MAKGNGTKSRTKLYKSYLFRGKDPAIDELRTLLEDHFGARIASKHLRMIEEAGGPSVGAMQGWFFGTTQRPTNPTLEACGRATGHRRKWVKL